ncbi:MAG: DUF5666 domain-containing protein [Candidatus Aureabacteria bacterium]|nr:DUF5666 domain-containing protein [Candidatus Auribacterota bacterium]
MNPVRRSIRALTGAPLLASATFSLSTCGGIGGSELSGGGTGGTGISTGSISGFGSVLMNGVHYRTDDEVSPGFRTKKIAKAQDRSGTRDRDLFRVGMVVTVRHSPGDNNAAEIDYAPNLVGPIASKDSVPDLSIQVLGHPVLLDNAALFASLAQGSIVEVSGFVDDSGRIRATFVDAMHLTPMAGETFEIKGFISGPRPSDGTFEIGPLPDGSGITVTVSYPPGAVRELPLGPASGMYVQVLTRDTQPGSGRIRADAVTPFVPRTVFPEGATVDLDGLVTRIDTPSGNILSFELEGKAVQTDGATVFLGGTGTDLQPNARVQVQGMETGGVLSATKIIFR